MAGGLITAGAMFGLQALGSGLDFFVVCMSDRHAFLFFLFWVSYTS